ncbi:MAG: hypothetical protein SGJ24_06490 [Chloroflexota bacterium]|nr:hypothetical protein [Chloroflexota bacterium]
MNIWDFQAMLSRRLAQWAAISFSLGAVMMIGRAFWRGVGGQFAGWAVVNVAIAFFGSRVADDRRKKLKFPDIPAVQSEERGTLRNLLWLNAGLDVLYMLGGAALTRSDSAARRGMGIGIVLQGAFLFVFDIWHALALRETLPEYDDV